MNASVAVVIVGHETNITLSWTTDFPPVLLTDELSDGDNQTNDKCNNFGRVATKGSSVVSLSIGLLSTPTECIPYQFGIAIRQSILPHGL